MFSIEHALLGLHPPLYDSAKRALQELQHVVENRAGLILRDDSRLAWSYITGDLPNWTAENIADELALTHYLHNYTDYHETSRCVLPVVRQTLEQTLFRQPHMREHVWEFVHKFIIPIYRMEAMLNRHPTGDFPTVWPWQLSVDEEPEEDSGSVYEEEEEEHEDDDSTSSDETGTTSPSSRSSSSLDVLEEALEELGL